MEFGSLHQYTKLEIEFLNYISENVGIAINSAESRKKMRELLEETQAQAEELQTQHSELENMNAEKIDTPEVAYAKWEQLSNELKKSMNNLFEIL